MRAIRAVLAAFLLFSPPSYAAAVVLAQASGVVQTRLGADPWGAVAAGFVLKAGAELKTGRNAKAMLTFDDGSRVEIGPNSFFQLEDAAPQKVSMRFSLGRLRAWVSKNLAQRFTVRTPTAVCSVRGTEFGVAVAEGGATNVELFTGLLAVGDGKGNEVLLKPGESVNVDAAGLGRVGGADGGAGESGDKTRAALKREVGLDMTKEEVQAAAAIEQKSAVYQQGKAMIDVNGNRVRIEDYIIRSAANEFKLVVLNERTDRFDFFYYKGTFNTALPDDISGPLSQIQGQPFAAPAYYLTKYEKGWSNTADRVLENAWGGHLVDVNNNANATANADGTVGDAVYSAYDPKTDGVVNLKVGAPGVNNPLQNDPYFAAIFDHYTLAYNGVNHVTWDTTVGDYTGAALTGAQGMHQVALGAGGTSLVQGGACLDVNRCTGFPEPDRFHQIIYSESADGAKWDKWDNYIISDEGKVADVAQFLGGKGATFKELLLPWNYQQIITASEFGGRKIDLVFEPKILIQSGLVR